VLAVAIVMAKVATIKVVGSFAYPIIQTVAIQRYANQ